MFSSLRIGIEHVRFLHVDVVVVVNTENADRPFDRLEGGLAFEEIDADREIVREKELVAAAEKFRAVRARALLTPLGVGSGALRIERNRSAVRLRKMSWPMIGASPLSVLCK